jgi:hypothetical protein
MGKKTSKESPLKTLPSKRIRVRKLHNTQEVAKFQARIIKQAVKGGGDVVNNNYKLCMMASMLAKTLETSDLERRIEALEAQSTKGKG